MRRSGTLIFILLFVISFNSYAEKTEVKRIDPPSWWVGMNNPNLQLMVYGENIAETLPVINNTGVALKDVIRLESPNYLFLNLIILPEAKPGILEIQFKKGKKIIDTYEYSLYQRNADPGLYQGFDNSDVIYLLMPDRFSNGNPENDEVEGMLEKPDRKNPLGRHGGDIQGIVDHLDYLEELGVTALWINPLAGK